MATFLCRITTLIVFGLSAFAAERYAVDWPRINPETLQHFTALVRLDTSNPPGNETKAARYLEGVLEKEGISAEQFAVDPQRANLIARLRGDGSRRPLLLLGHTDVVGVQRQKWAVDPFEALRKDGAIWGRGTQDDKDHVVAGLMVMLLLKRMQVPLVRDVIFVAEAGEEGTTSVGIDALIARRWPEIEAEYALAEGASTVASQGKVRYVGVSTTEKVPRGIRLVAHGTAGHGSRPVPDNAVIRLAAAVARVGGWQPAPRLNETTRAYFHRLAAISPPAQAARYRRMRSASGLEDIDKHFRSNELTHYTMIRTSVTPTILRAGFRSNVIPSEAEAYLDVRALPDEDLNQFVEQLRGVINDSTIDVVLPRASGRPAAPPSRLDTEMFRALENTQRRMYPGAVTIPTMLPAATDLAQLRAKGVQAYGWGGIQDPAVSGGGAHSDDEHIQESSLYGMVEFLWRTVLEVAAK